MSARNLEMLKIVAQGLNDKRSNFVFLGGVTVALYSTDSAAPDSRPTIDVDCVIEITSYPRYIELEKELHQLGFVNDTSEDAPLCRFLYQGIKVDVMSTPYDPLGFNTKWYTEGLRHTHELEVAPGIRINIMVFPYFLATKLAALEERDNSDIRIVRTLKT